MRSIVGRKFVLRWAGMLALAAGLSAAGPEARAGLITWTADPNQGPDASFVVKDTFNDLTPGSSAAALRNGYDLTFSGTAQVFQGSVSGLAKEPEPISSAVATAFGVAPGDNLTPYLSTGIGSIVFNLDGLHTGMGLLWGTVDTYNSLSFYDASDNLIETITGSQIIGSGYGSASAYVNLFSSVAFKKVVASSTSYAFELDNVAFSQAVPEPSSLTLALVPMLMGGAAVVRRQIRRRV